MAYATLGTIYDNLGETDKSKEYRKKAFELRDRVSEREKFYITAWYYSRVTGETDRAIRALELWKDTYPRDNIPWNNLSFQFGSEGQHDRALEMAQQALRLDPDSQFSYAAVAFAFICLNRFEEAKAVRERQLARGIDELGAHMDLYAIAFLDGDTAAMERHARWVAGKRGATAMFRVQAQINAMQGKLRTAREFYQRSTEAAQQESFKEFAAHTLAIEALTEAEFGNCTQARQRANSALAISRGTGVRGLAAYALGVCGETGKARSLAEDLKKESPTDVLMNKVTIPIIEAELELQRGNAKGAADLLEPARAYELGGRRELQEIYVRGQAYLRAKQGKEAIAEFRKLIEHKGVLLLLSNPIYYVLAHLGLARAYALAGDTAISRRAYQDFFALWKDADPDIPILQQAKAEYAKLK